LLSGFLASVLGGHDWLGALVGAASIGAAKEIRDKVSGLGTPDVMDFVATVIGGCIVAIAFWFPA
jgi:branched-subunit amino acid ABC-type transport system permease component